MVRNVSSTIWRFPTPIARVPRHDRGALVAVVVVGIFALAADTWMIRNGYAAYSRRALLAFVGVVSMLVACRGDRRSVGLTLKTVQGARWWWRATALVALVMGALLLLAVGVLVVTGNFRVVRLAPSDLGPAVLHACVWAPLVEEALYRVVLVVPLAAVLRPGWAILLSGLVFAALHVLYGNPAPTNALGGFFMTWAYLKSGSLLVPLLYHAAGNLFVLATQVGAYYAGL